MSFNPNDTSYTYTVNQDGTVNYTAACDGLLQPSLSGIDVSSVDSIESYLDAYTLAYISGLQSVQVVAPGEGVPVGTPQTANAGS